MTNPAALPPRNAAQPNPEPPTQPKVQRRAAQNSVLDNLIWLQGTRSGRLNLDSKR
ncbi:MAG TPA: hypothetical protein VN520_03495 [Streptomyces sp.]|uniref:hypothetical protein n=1 Tax=Streptomyces sp. TaxID=1931 RepID=UPI002CBE4788|nr:hypothetical protein [Streptomyces sp.]HWU05461.1 hypothetical protein [Streptomyces sp.]